MTPPADNRRDYGSGSIYQRNSDGLWIGSFYHGYTETGRRRRIVVAAKTEAAAKRKLRDKMRAAEQGEVSTGRATVASWAEQYLAIRVRELSPKGYNAAANPIKNWVVPTIGHRRLDALTPADIRAVADAQRRAGRQSADTHRALMTMLRAAIVEGHHVPQRVLMVKPEKQAKSDRGSMTVAEGMACIEVASNMPNGTRWLFTLLYGPRQGECLGMTWDAIDWTAGAFGEAVIEWQLQPLPYNVQRDRSSGFRVPDGYEARHLVDSYHLVRPKSKQGFRVAPLLEPVRDALLRWQQAAPASPYGLIWPEPNGRPRNDKHDRQEWWDLQEAAGVHHPTRTRLVNGETLPSYYHVHECRNFAATMLLEAGVDEHVVTSLLGHSSVITSRRYMTVRREPLLEALTRVGERLQLGSSTRQPQGHN